MTYPITIIAGGQYGSEAKGLVAAYLGNQRSMDIAVRTGATNAGHTVIHKGKTYKMQQLPVGWVNPDTMLVLGAGSLIDPEILAREVAMLEADGIQVRNRIRVDYRAGLHTHAHTVRSKASGRHHRMGATGKGCSEALIDRIRNRGSELPELFGTSRYAKGYDVVDTELLLNGAWDGGAKILLEGTQGQLLDLYLGPYPYVTHKQTGPAQWLLECGLSPSLPTDIVMVIRTFPIRVAGNSGPLPDEISWPELARELNTSLARRGMQPIIPEHNIRHFEDAMKSVSVAFRMPEGSDGLDQHEWSEAQRLDFREAVSEQHKVAFDTMHKEAFESVCRLYEMTTVTRKLRRIARLNRDSLVDASRQIRPSRIAITFMNYLFPYDWYGIPEVLSQEAMELVQYVEEACSAPVSFLSWGPTEEATTTIRGGNDWMRTKR